jgi:preprotein translocase subunit YajC
VLGSLSSILAANGSSTGSGLASILVFLVPMALIFYFLIIRPQRRQREAQRQLIESIDVGDEVVTIGGVYGTVRALDDESITLEVSPGMDIRFARGAVARKLTEDDQYDEYEEEPADQEEGAGDQS